MYAMCIECSIVGHYYVLDGLGIIRCANECQVCL